jgi:hypothetical protein
MSSDLWSNEYGAPAGKGYADRRRRERLELKDINARTMNTTRTKPKHKPRPYLAKPEHEQRKKKQVKLNDEYHTAIGLKAKIRTLVILNDVSFLTLMDILKREGSPVSAVTASNVRRDCMEIVKLMDELGVLDKQALARKRKAIEKGQ